MAGLFEAPDLKETIDRAVEKNQRENVISGGVDKTADTARTIPMPTAMPTIEQQIANEADRNAPYAPSIEVTPSGSIIKESPTGDKTYWDGKEGTVRTEEHTSELQSLS